jgi:hypothetical protein
VVRRVSLGRVDVPPASNCATTFVWTLLLIPTIAVSAVTRVPRARHVNRGRVNVPPVLNRATAFVSTLIQTPIVVSAITNVRTKLLVVRGPVQTCRTIQTIAADAELNAPR